MQEPQQQASVLARLRYNQGSKGHCRASCAPSCNAPVNHHTSNVARCVINNKHVNKHNPNQDEAVLHIAFVAPCKKQLSLIQLPARQATNRHPS